jgi:hypothetical protein
MDYITFARIETVRSGTRNEILIEPPLSLEVFPAFASFGSSLLLKESFRRVDKYLSRRHEWRRWLQFLKPQQPNGTPIDGTFVSGPSTDVKLIPAPVAVHIDDEKLLRTAASAFEKQQTVVVRVRQEYRDSLAQFILIDIELTQER